MKRARIVAAMAVSGPAAMLSGAALIFFRRNTATAWHSKASWYAVSKLDKTINLDPQSGH
jgi:hypothetical protein